MSNDSAVPRKWNVNWHSKYLVEAIVQTFHRFINLLSFRHDFSDFIGCPAGNIDALYVAQLLCLGYGDPLFQIELKHLLQQFFQVFQLLVAVELDVVLFEKLSWALHELQIIRVVKHYIFERVVQSEHVNQKYSHGENIDLRKVVHDGEFFSLHLLGRHELFRTRQKSFEDLGAFIKFRFGQRRRIRKIDYFGVGKVISKHNVPRLQISVAVTSLVHVTDRIQYLAEVVMCYVWSVSAKLLHIEIELTTSETLDGHGVVNVKFLSSTMARFRSFDYPLRNHFDQAHDVRVTLDSLENFRVVHENYLLVQIRFVSFVEIRALNNFERLVFHIFCVFKIDNGIINLLKIYRFGALENLGKLRNNFCLRARIGFLLFLVNNLLIWLVLEKRVKAGEVNC